MILVCDWCGKEYKTYATPRCPKHYCSRDCFSKAHDKRIKIKCFWCNKDVLKNPNDKKKRLFCSVECHNAYQARNKLELVCRTCHRKFYRSPSWTKQKKGYYCSLECRDQDENYGKRSWMKANLVQNRKKGLNKLEQRGHKILVDMGYVFMEQVLIANKVCVDVYIPDKKLIIQWDGDYWHGKGKNINEAENRIKQRMLLDKSQDTYLQKCGFRVLRFWESEVNNKENYVVETIRKAVQ